MDLGCARVSTGVQTLDLQLEALAKADCGRIFTETASSAAREPPLLQEAVDYLRPEDTLVVWRLDHLGRSLQHLIETVTELQDRALAFEVTRGTLTP